MIVERDAYVWVCPEGYAELSTLATTEVNCLAITELLHSKGLGKSELELRCRGFTIKKVCLTIIEQL